MKSFCIIGCGISGIISAKYCLEKKFDVKILEKNSNAGGVWFSEAYPNIKLQTTKFSYAFSDFPHKKNTSLYPTGVELSNYIDDYCKKHNIFKYCEFNSNVYKTRFKNNKWIIYYKNDNIEKKITTDYLIVASGIYGKKRNTIDCSNTNKILEAKNINEKEVANKKIVIIGNGPTGCDMAEICNKYKAKSIYLLYRSNRWIFQRYLWNKISTHDLLCRFNMLLASKTPKHIYLIFIMIFYFIIYIFSHKRFSLKIVPPYNVINRNNLVLNETILDLITNNDINYEKIQNVTINHDTIQFNNKLINYDKCILCTGYNTDIQYLGLDTLPKLFNNILFPDFKNCAFIGFAESFNWIQVSELQIKWFLENLDKFSKDYMLQQIDNRMKQMDKNYRYNDLAIDVYNYCDNLSKKKMDKYNLKYWFKTPKYNYWI